jgi:STE24 endopeptidase
MFMINIYNTLIDLPFSVYSHFVLEERFGFNKLTAKLFVIDLLKSQLLTVVLGSPILSAIIYCINWGGASFYLCRYLRVFRSSLSISLSLSLSLYLSLELWNSYTYCDL